ncbi:MAG: lipid II:glycine glycyltransferase FemX [Chloroflexota bacterium]
MRVRLVQDPAAWATLADASPRGGILQSYQWGQFKAQLGWRPLRLLVDDGARSLGGAQLLLRATPLGAVAYVPRGPLSDPADRELTDAVFTAVHRAARRAGAFFLKIEPDWPHSPALESELRARGFRPGAAVQPRSTIVVDLTPAPEALLARVSRHTRYNVRLAERRGLRCQVGGEADLGDFYRLLVATARRGHFYVHPDSYYRELWRRFAPEGVARLLLVRRDGEALAATMFFCLGGVAYQLYSGSATAQRRLKPNDLLQWRALLWARELGCRGYDMWGIPDEAGRAESEGQRPLAGEGAVSGTFEGVYRFKRNFGGRVVRNVGSFDFVYSPARYWLWCRCRPVVDRLREWVADRTTPHGGAASGLPALEAYED